MLNTISEHHQIANSMEILHLSPTANPSHLEAVNPVVIGKARAKQEQLKDNKRTSVHTVLLHGDAAGRGV